MNEETLMQRMKRSWQNFWFEPASPTPIALFRIFCGLFVIQSLTIHTLADWQLYYGDHPLVPIEAIIAKYWGDSPYFDMMLLLPSGEIWRWYFFWFSVAMAVLMTLGLFTRFSSVATFLCLLSLQQHFPINQNSGDNFLRIACMFVAMSNAGDAFSIDNLLKSMRQDWRITGFRPPLSSPWAQRLVQVQLAIAYAHAWGTKLNGDSWENGTAVYYATRYDDIMRFPLPFILDNMWCIKALTWGTLVIEFLLFTLIWWRPARYWVILLGIGLHLGIEWTMNLPIFEWLFISTYLTYVYPEDLTRAMDRLKGFIHRHILKPCDLIFDGNCIFCVRTIGFLHRLDIFGLVSLHDVHSLESFACKAEVDMSRAQNEILLRTTSGRWLFGFQAFRHMALRFPWTCLLAPLLYLPLVAQSGDLIYKLIAARRYIILGGTCTHTSCAPAAGEAEGAESAAAESAELDSSAVK